MPFFFLNRKRVFLLGKKAISLLVYSPVNKTNTIHSLYWLENAIGL